MDKKFNKANVSEVINYSIECLQNQYGFDDRNGSAQVNGEDEDMVIAYGKFSALQELHYELFGTDKNFYR